MRDGEVKPKSTVSCGVNNQICKHFLCKLSDKFLRSVVRKQITDSFLIVKMEHGEVCSKGWNAG